MRAERPENVLLELIDSATRRREELVATLSAAVDADCTEVAIALRHVHLPKLVDAGYVTLDEEAGTVRRGPRFGEVRPIV